MDAAMGIELLAYGVALAFGIVAARSWRRAGRPVLEGFGLTIDRRTGPDLADGLAIAAVAMVGILLVERGAGGIQVGPGTFDARSAAFIGLFLLGSGAIDEILMRGMLVSGVTLCLGGRRIVAVVLAAIPFGLTHVFFAGASAASVLSNGIGGVMYGLAFVLTGRIWLGLGLHVAWNFVQGPLLGFPVSGHVLGRGFLRIDDLGPAWLTGGVYGPEGGLVGIGFRFVVMGAILAGARRPSLTGARAGAPAPGRRTGPG